MQEGGKTGSSLDRAPNAAPDCCDYLDNRTASRKKSAVGLKKPINGRKDGGQESSLNRQQSSKNLNYSVSDGKDRPQSVQKQPTDEEELIKTTEPTKLLPKTHHFTSFDHEKLGVDMMHIFHKTFIKSQSGPAMHKTQEEIQKIVAKFATKLAFKQVAPLANAQSISQAYGAGGHHMNSQGVARYRR